MAVWRLLYDERPIQFRDQDEEQVWLCFNRRCGLARSQAKLVGQGEESLGRGGESPTSGSGDRSCRQEEVALFWGMGPHFTI